MLSFVFNKCLYFSCVSLAVVESEIAADGEGLGLLLDLGFFLDFGRTLRLAFDLL